MRTTLALLITIGVVLLHDAASAQRAVQVRDEDGSPLSGIVSIVTDDGMERQGDTGTDGYLDLRRQCGDHERIHVDAPPTYHDSTPECDGSSGTLEIMLTRSGVVGNLEANLQRSIAAAEWAKAALIENELRARLGTETQESASSLIYFGRYLGLEDSESIRFDPLQQRNVMSPLMRSRVEQFQVNNEVSVTGQLDYQTLSKAAEAHVGRYLYYRPEIRTF